MDMQAAIKAVIERHDLSAEEMESVMRLVMTGAATPAQIGGLLIGLRKKIRERSDSRNLLTRASLYHIAI